MTDEQVAQMNRHYRLTIILLLLVIGTIIGTTFSLHISDAQTIKMQQQIVLAVADIQSNEKLRDDEIGLRMEVLRTRLDNVAEQQESNVALLQELKDEVLIKFKQ